MKPVLKKPSFAALPFVLLGLSALFGGCAGAPSGGFISGYPVSGTDPYPTSEAYTSPDIEIRQADGLFGREEFAAARQEYQRFLELHPLHEKAPYAQYRIARSYRRTAVSPDRDPEPMEKTMAELEKLLRNYPRSNYAPAAANGIAECRNWLAEAGFIRGKFYYHKGNYRAAAARFESIFRSYPETAAAQEARAYLESSQGQMANSGGAPKHASFFDRPAAAPVPAFSPVQP